MKKKGIESSVKMVGIVSYFYFPWQNSRPWKLKEEFGLAHSFADTVYRSLEGKRKEGMESDQEEKKP